METTPRLDNANIIMQTKDNKHLMTTEDNFDQVRPVFH